MLNKESQERINELLAKPVTRKQFLQHVGMALLSIFGVTALMGNLLNINPKSGTQELTENGRGFGTRKFGV